MRRGSKPPASHLSSSPSPISPLSRLISSCNWTGVPGDGHQHASAPLVPSRPSPWSISSVARLSPAFCPPRTFNGDNGWTSMSSNRSTALKQTFYVFEDVSTAGRGINFSPGRSTTSGLKRRARSSRFRVAMFSAHGDVSTRRRCIRRWRAWIPPSASFSRAAPGPLICLMSPSHRKHGNIWRQDNTLKAFCSSLIAHGSAPTISHLPPYRLAFIAQA